MGCVFHRRGDIAVVSVLFHQRTTHGLAGHAHDLLHLLALLRREHDHAKAVLPRQHLSVLCEWRGLRFAVLHCDGLRLHIVLAPARQFAIV